MSDNGAAAPEAACTAAAGRDSDSGRSRSDGAPGIADTSAVTAAVTSRTASNTNHSSKKRMPTLIYTPRRYVTQSNDADKYYCMNNLHNESIFHEEQHVQPHLAAVPGSLAAKDGAGPPLPSKGDSDCKAFYENDANYSMNVIANAAALASATEAKAGGQGGEGESRQLPIMAALASSALPLEQKTILDVMMCHVASSHGDNPVALPSTELAEREKAQMDETKVETKVKDAVEHAADAGMVAANSTADTAGTTITATDDNAVVDCASPMLSGFAVSQSLGKEHSEKCEPPSPPLQRHKENGFLFTAKKIKIDAIAPNHSRAVSKTTSLGMGMVRVVVYTNEIVSILMTILILMLWPFMMV
jgi:hypothetical protein